MNVSKYDIAPNKFESNKIFEWTVVGTNCPDGNETELVTGPHIGS